MTDRVIGGTPFVGRMVVLKLKGSILAVLQFYAPNDQPEYTSFILDVETDNFIPTGPSTLIWGMTSLFCGLDCS
ncbi:UNVERIFIED_CONTAM: hypothetical protein PYX00_005683 [Menopon gallinae]|uniref:Uncharacterized protein n=1 Tax=Menopon gallinae TaxID=328185 RepID=A0AAW2HU81_9NEOP